MAGSEQAPSRVGVRSAKTRAVQRTAAPTAGSTADVEAEPPASSTPPSASSMPAPAQQVMRPTSPSLTMLSIEDLVRLLRIMGSAAASAELVRADIEAGAPTNSDGSINFVHYAAWLERLGG